MTSVERILYQRVATEVGKPAASRCKKAIRVIAGFYSRALATGTLAAFIDGFEDVYCNLADVLAKKKMNALTDSERVLADQKIRVMHALLRIFSGSSEDGPPLPSHPES